MDLTLSDTDRLLAASARRMLGPHATVDALRTVEAGADGFDKALWDRAVDLGWTGLPFAVERGGGGGDLVSAGVLAVELGRAAVPTPLLAGTEAAVVVDRLGDTPGADELVRDVAAGRARAALVAPWSSGEAPTASGDAVTGGPWIVDWADAADVVVMTVRAGDGWRLLAVRRPDLDVVPVASSDNERIASVRADAAPGIALTGGVLAGDAAQDALAAARLLRGASLVGTAERALELTVDHVSGRHQFGQPLGRFQAVQHACADVALQRDGARLAVFHALSRASRGLPCAGDAAIASYVAGRAAELAVVTGAQLHGGVGFIVEHELPVHFRRAKAGQLRLGGEVRQLERIASRLPRLMAAGWEGRPA